MEFDYNILLEDINKLIRYLIRNEKRSAMETLSDLDTYNGLLEHLSGIEINRDRLFMNNEKLNEYLAKYFYDGVKRITDFLNTNGDDLNTLATNINSLINPETIVHIYNGRYLILDKSRIFNEKEFKDILLSFFSQYNNNIYKVVKKMFDEKRIKMGGKINEGCEGYTVSSNFTKDAFIIIRNYEFTIDNLVMLAHELGHVIHFYTSVLSNGEKKAFASPYSETISCSFEIAFLDYLMKNYIEPSSALLFLNDKFVRDLNSFYKYTSIKKQDEYHIDEDGIISSTSGDLSFIGSPVEADLNYTLGYAIALNMLLKYGDDKKEFVKKLNNLMYLMNRQSFRDNLNTLGFDCDDFLQCRTIGPYVKEKNQELIHKLIK